MCITFFITCILIQFVGFMCSYYILVNFFIGFYSYHACSNLALLAIAQLFNNTRLTWRMNTVNSVLCIPFTVQVLVLSVFFFLKTLFSTVAVKLHSVPSISSRSRMCHCHFPGLVVDRNNERSKQSSRLNTYYV